MVGRINSAEVHRKDNICPWSIPVPQSARFRPKSTHDFIKHPGRRLCMPTSCFSRQTDNHSVFYHLFRNQSSCVSLSLTVNNIGERWRGYAANVSQRAPDFGLLRPSRRTFYGQVLDREGRWRYGRTPSPVVRFQKITFVPHSTSASARPPHASLSCTPLLLPAAPIRSVTRLGREQALPNIA